MCGSFLAYLLACVACVGRSCRSNLGRKCIWCGPWKEKKTFRTSPFGVSSVESEADKFTDVVCRLCHLCRNIDRQSTNSLLRPCWGKGTHIMHSNLIIHKPVASYLLNLNSIFMILFPPSFSRGRLEIESNPERGVKVLMEQCNPLP